MKMLLAIAVIAGVIFYFFTQMNNQQAAKENIRLGDEFLAANGNKEGVVTTPSGLQYLPLSKGEESKGEGQENTHPKASDTVTVHYHGTLIDGTVFDSSVERGEPIAFPLNRVIKGWTEGLQLMSVGDKYRFFLPSELAYGNRSTGKIEGGSVLIFDVELIKIGD
jgi:peptidylprolyl isomerase